jgi:hypothetical protein
MANALSTFVHEDLSSAVEHFVTLLVNDIVALKDELPVVGADAHAIMVEMALIWADLLPYESIVIALFPAMAPLFAVLSSAVAIDQQFLAVAALK